MYGLQKIVDFVALENLQMQVEYWFLTTVLVWATLAQLVAAGAVAGSAHLLGRRAKGWLERVLGQRRFAEHSLRVLVASSITLTSPMFALGLLVLLIAVAAAVGWPHLVLSTLANLLAVWIVIRFTSGLIRHEAAARLVAMLAFTVATLNILGLLQPTILFLDGIGLHVGGTYVSLLSLIKGGVQLAVLLWLAVTGSHILERRIARAPSLTPSIQVLTGKLLKTTFIAVAFLIALSSAGIDLTAFAVFTGAVGVGVGFGLQKLVSNLISGVILLLDRSIKPGDVIEVGDTYGWVSSLNARYASVTTRDGKEWLIPNEDLITQRVTNWSYSHERLRLQIPFGISYDSDVPKAMTIAVESAREVQRVLCDPAPQCRLMGFGDSSVSLELRIWIRDPANGIINVRSEVLLNMWERFHQHGILIPFAQRDLHIKSDSELNVILSRERVPRSA